MSNLVIGIEGLVGAGKTSICRYIIENNENESSFELKALDLLNSIKGK